MIPGAQSATDGHHQIAAALAAAHRRVPRLFLVEWDNSRTRTRDPRKNDKHEAYGTHYVNGMVTLDNGSVFTMMSELHHMLDLRGKYEINYLDEQEQEEVNG